MTGATPTGPSDASAADASGEVVRLRERLSYYESFDRIIQENIARSGEMMRDAADLRERTQAEMAQVRAEADRAREAAAGASLADREAQRMVFASLLDDVAAMEDAIDRLRQRVHGAMARLGGDFGTVVGGSLGAPETTLVATVEVLATGDLDGELTAGMGSIDPFRLSELAGGAIGGELDVDSRATGVGDAFDWSAAGVEGDAATPLVEDPMSSTGSGSGREPLDVSEFGSLAATLAPEEDPTAITVGFADEVTPSSTEQSLGAQPSFLPSIADAVPDQSDGVDVEVAAWVAAAEATAGATADIPSDITSDGMSDATSDDGAKNSTVDAWDGMPTPDGGMHGEATAANPDAPAADDVWLEAEEGTATEQVESADDDATPGRVEDGEGSASWGTGPTKTVSDAEGVGMLAETSERERTGQDTAQSDASTSTVTAHGDAAEPGEPGDSGDDDHEGEASDSPAGGDSDGASGTGVESLSPFVWFDEPSESEGGAVSGDEDLDGAAEFGRDLAGDAGVTANGQDEDEGLAPWVEPGSMTASTDAVGDDPDSARWGEPTSTVGSDDPDATPVDVDGEFRSVTVLVHGVPRAATALSLQRHLAGLPHVDGVEAREYAEGVLRLQVMVMPELRMDDLQSWHDEDGATLEPIHVQDDVLEVRLPGGDF